MKYASRLIAKTKQNLSFRNYLNVIQMLAKLVKKILYLLQFLLINKNN